MTKKFDTLYAKIMEDAETVGSVFGNDGAYVLPDGPIPYVMGTYSRKGKHKKKCRKRKN